MGEKVVVGPVNKGLRNDVTPFVIDNDAFPVLVNAYQWRGRVKRKRGTSLLNRLTRFFNSSSLSYSSFSSIALVGGAANILTGFDLQTNGNIIPGSVTIVDTTASNTYTDPGKNGILVGSPVGSGTINYATGAITISGGATDMITAAFLYYPDLPVMGLEDFITTSTQFPGTIGFDTEYAYNITTAFPYRIYDVSFYKNPPTGLYPGYVQKSVVTPTSWNGQNYQQFWTVNYQGALWATNGINVPFAVANIGMQFAPSSTIGYISNTATTLTVTITGSPLVVGDFVFLNEWTGTNAKTLNFQTGFVTSVSGTTYVITFIGTAFGAGPYTPGIIQYLTNRSDTTKDCLRWYDGDPTNGNALSPALTGNLGWVNFAPPLSSLNYSISDEPPAQYYLVGARMIVPFKDRLLFFGPVIQTSSPNSQVYLQDTVIYSQNGTAYYTASFTGNPQFVTTVFNPILVPVDQTATPNAYWEDQTGFGGFIQAGIDQEILTVGANEDVLIVGFTRLETRLVYSGNDIVPFNFFIINSELGSGSTFSSITMDKGVISRGSRGFIMTSQVESSRIDLEIPDEVFQMSLLNNGTERVTAQRDYINEWIYFTYPYNQENPSNYLYPTQTLQYNYRDNSWAVFRESYTTYGQFRKQTGFTWATVGTVYPTWRQWTDPWNASASTLLQPEVIGGNQQGFVLTRADGTGEGSSLYIQNIVGSTITSPDHCLNVGDYITINGALGTVATAVNGNIFSVAMVSQNSFVVNPPIATGLTYIGSGTITRMYVPFIQSKQFPVSWGMGRKTRLGPQQYLLTTTNNSQITLLIYLSQDATDGWNAGPVIPSDNSANNSLIYSSILYTCPESANLGLTPANTNLQMVTAPSQQQIWHRVNTSLLGDTIQVGFTMSDAQMRDVNFTNQFAEIELHGFILDTNPSQLLA